MDLSLWHVNYLHNKIKSVTKEDSFNLFIQAVKGKRKQSSVHNISIPLDGGNVQDSGKIQSADVTQLSLRTDVDNTQRKDNSLDSIDSLSPITREDILQASITTCAAIAVSGVCIQQVNIYGCGPYTLIQVLFYFNV